MVKLHSMVPMKLVEIAVTEDDLATGIPMHQCACPVAVAINRVIRDGYADVTYHWIVINTRRWEDKVEVAVPTEVRPRLIDFDQRREVEPFTFTLNLPEAILR